MWLLPSGYCFALQASSIQNDGYSMNYVLAAIVFAVMAWKMGSVELWLMSMLASALLTGAKLSNVPLLLPLGVLLLPAIPRIKWATWKTPAMIVVALVCSFAPMAFLCTRITGDWAGDPSDQWDVKTHSLAGGMLANAALLADDVIQPPILPGSKRVAPALDAVTRHAGPLLDWMKRSHHHFGGLQLGDMAYEGSAGIGFGIGMYVLLLLVVAPFARARAGTSCDCKPPLAWWIVPWLAWVSYAVYLMKLGSPHTARIAAPYLCSPDSVPGSIAAFSNARTWQTIFHTLRPGGGFGVVGHHVHSRAPAHSSANGGAHFEEAGAGKSCVEIPRLGRIAR